MPTFKPIFTELLSLSYPSLPFFQFIPEGVNIGTVIYIEGYVPPNCSKFAIDLIDGQAVDERTWEQADIPYGLYFLFDDRLVIGNTRRDREWGHPQKDKFNAISKGDNFEMKIIVEEKYYKVIMNGKVMQYQHRMATDRAKLLRIEGQVVIKRIEFRHGKHYHKSQLDFY
ncbi:galectin-4-like [Oppia nitens]|uniref:galectin-4-like n=1 Tax=Oppia nitens TaxID=1686743 RepID=UPI0023DB62E8|nr:galectin-4-like [Oppia nitens]